MIKRQHTYTAHQSTTLEWYDACLATSRLNAAKHFAEKKKLSLKDWLKIYTVLRCDGDRVMAHKMRHKNIYFKIDGETVLQFKCLAFDNNRVIERRLNEKKLHEHKRFYTMQQFIDLSKHLVSEGHEMVIEK